MAITKKRIPISQRQQRGGISFFGALTILFIGLKITHKIDWSWVWVVSPIWLPMALFLGPIAIVALGLLVVMLGEIVVAYVRETFRKK
jgi:hypothetical protein